MPNDCSCTVIVPGLQGDPSKFAQALEHGIYGEILNRLLKDPDEEDKVLELEFFYRKAMGPLVKVLPRRHCEFHFETNWGPNLSGLVTLSRTYKAMPFLVRYSCWESRIRGRAVICGGEMLEHFHRLDYWDPRPPSAKNPRPVLILSDPFLGPTLSQLATKRLNDSIEIVRDLKESLEDRRFTNLSHPTAGNKERVRQTRDALAAMLTARAGHANQISFEGVLLEPTEKRARVPATLPLPGLVCPPRGDLASEVNWL